jgi:predicted protein tyrosine phosphatase
MIHGRIVVPINYCAAGVSRSSCIAVGVLAKHFGFTFEAARELVYQKVPIADILPCHVKQLKKLFT